MKALIVDDEPMPGKHLEGLVRKHCFEISEVKVINSPLKAIEDLSNNEYDIIFLDIEMPVLNGLELLEKIQLPEKTHVIFTTAYSQYAIEAFKVNATHYLLKMVTKEDLIDAVRKVSHLKYKSNNIQKLPSLSIFIGEEYVILSQEKIIRLEADGSYTKIITATNDEFLSTKMLGYYEKLLSDELFYRCHNSHIINFKKVHRLSKGKKGYVVMGNEDIVPLATAKREQLMQLLVLKQ